MMATYSWRTVFLSEQWPPGLTAALLHHRAGQRRRCVRFGSARRLMLRHSRVLWRSLARTAAARTSGHDGLSRSASQCTWRMLVVRDFDLIDGLVEPVMHSQGAAVDSERQPLTWSACSATTEAEHETDESHRQVSPNWPDRRDHEPAVRQPLPRREGLDNIYAAWSAHHAAAERRYRVTPGSLTSWFVHRRNINTTTAPVSTSETAHRPNALASNRRFPIRRR